MPVRILHFIGQIGVGGCEKQLLELCRRIDHTKYHLGLCYYSPNTDNMVEQFTQAGVQLFYVDKFGGMSPLRFFSALRDTIRQFTPDLIHTWLYSANFWGRLAGRSLGCRCLIASERSIMTPYPLQFRLSERLLRSSIWTANSQAAAGRVRKILGVPKDRMKVLYNAVEMPPRDRQADRHSVRQELGLPPEQVLVVMVGRLAEPKDYPMFFRAADAVTSQRKDITFLCVGHGECEQDLRTMLQKMKLEPRLRMLGLRHDVSRLLHAADIFCLSSKFEGFPNAVAEAMTAGLPVVCTRFEGVDEVLQDGRTGRLVDVGDDKAMAREVMALAGDDKARASLGQAAACWTQENLSWRRLLAEIDKLYELGMEGKL